MPNGASSATAAAERAASRPRRGRPTRAAAALRVLLVALALGATAVLAAACATGGPAATTPGGGGSGVAQAEGRRGTGGVREAPHPPTAALSLDEATVALARAIFEGAEHGPGDAPRPDAPRVLVLDPLIDRATGAQTRATRRMEARIAEVVARERPGLLLRPFGTESLAARPLVFLGAITAVPAEGVVPAQATGRPGAYRIWAVLGDLRTGRVVSHKTAWVRADDVDAAPAPFFAESPAWSPEPVVAAYLATCAREPGEPIEAAYLEALQAQALLADAIRAQEAGEAERALAAFRAADGLPGADRTRARNGEYLTLASLGRAPEAEAAFGRLVEHGLDRGRLGVKFVFRPGATAFWPDPAVSGPYPGWLRQIAARAAAREGACLDLTGHASPTGSASLNDRLSRARAERVRADLARERPGLARRTRAEGRGSREPIVGSGADDVTDLLDRRVEFRPFACPTLARPGDGPEGTGGEAHASDAIAAGSGDLRLPG